MTIGGLILLILIVAVVFGVFRGRIDPFLRNLILVILAVLCIVALFALTGLFSGGALGRPLF